jgi:hypothetical protein
VPADVPELKALLAPYPSDDMICCPVSPRVGNVKNNDADRAACRVLTTGRRREGTIRGLVLYD